jgi:hypothetical protein
MSAASSLRPAELPPELQRWLIEEGDPSARYFALTELLDRPDSDPAVRAAHEKIGVEGWAAKILADQQELGHWEARHDDEGLYLPKYTATNWRLIVLSDLGMTRADPRISRPVRSMLELWGGANGSFGGRASETCITGNSARMLLRFGYLDTPELSSSIDWLLAAQKADGGWHCFPSEVGTLDCWEALAAFNALPRDRWTEAIRRSVDRGTEFYLERGLLTESDGSTSATWRRFHYPHHYYYDMLLGADLLAALGRGADPRLAPVLDEIENRQNDDGSWTLDAYHPDIDPKDPYHPTGPFYPFALEARGMPSRWITLLALRTLRRSGRV